MGVLKHATGLGHAGLRGEASGPADLRLETLGRSPAPIEANRGGATRGYCPALLDGVA